MPGSRNETELAAGAANPGETATGGMKESLQGSFACCRDSDRGVGRVAKASGKEGIFYAHLEG